MFGADRDLIMSALGRWQASPLGEPAQLSTLLDLLCKDLFLGDVKKTKKEAPGGR